MVFANEGDLRCSSVWWNRCDIYYILSSLFYACVYRDWASLVAYTIPWILVAFFTISWMCTLKFNLCPIVTPRYLTWRVHLMGVLQTVICLTRSDRMWPNNIANFTDELWDLIRSYSNVTVLGLRFKIYICLFSRNWGWAQIVKIQNFWNICFILNY